MAEGTIEKPVEIRQPPALAAYDAYVRMLGKLKTPDWSQLSRREREAWAHAVNVAILTAITMPADPAYTAQLRDLAIRIAGPPRGPAEG